MSFAGGGSEKEGSGLPGFSSHMKGTEATSLRGGFGTDVTEEDPGFQSFLGIPGLSSQRNGTEGGCLTCFFEFECCVNSFSTILELNLCPCRYSSVVLCIYMCVEKLATNYTC